MREHRRLPAGQQRSRLSAVRSGCQAGTPWISAAGTPEAWGGRAIATQSKWQGRSRYQLLCPEPKVPGDKQTLVSIGSWHLLDHGSVIPVDRALPLAALSGLGFLLVSNTASSRAGLFFMNLPPTKTFSLVAALLVLGSGHLELPPAVVGDG